ncbi:hypothetical protein PSNVIR_04677 [Pseudomonas sp. Nvir]|nr:hypothetical protein PSNVIR_04677 [Pseudomonas sp. Nvir]
MSPTMNVNNVAPTATAPNWWAWGRWPMTVLSTRATKGTEMLDRIIGAASAQTLWWVGRWRQSAVSAVIAVLGNLGLLRSPIATQGRSHIDRRTQAFVGYSEWAQCNGQASKPREHDSGQL